MKFFFGLLIPAIAIFPTVARADCMSAMIDTQQTLSRQSGVSVLFRGSNVSTYYTGAPKTRPYQLVFELSGDNAASLMSAGGVQRQAARYLISECPTLGAVEFVSESGEPQAAIGLLPSGKVDFFQCVRPSGGGGNQHPKWGQSFCRP